MMDKPGSPVIFDVKGPPAAEWHVALYGLGDNPKDQQVAERTLADFTNEKNKELFYPYVVVGSGNTPKPGLPGSAYKWSPVL